MRALTKLTCPFAVVAAVALTSEAANAQYGGAPEHMAQFAPMMEQFAPMMQQMAPMMQQLAPMMNSKAGRRYMRQMMQIAGPMMAQMMTQGGGDFGSFAGMPGAEGMMGTMGDRFSRPARRRSR